MFENGQWLIDQEEIQRLLENSDVSEDEDYEPPIHQSHERPSSDSDECSDEDDFAQNSSENVSNPTVPVWTEAFFPRRNLPIQHTCENKIEVLNPIQYFYKYLNDQHFEDTAFYTNMYYMKATGKELKTSRCEIKKLYGIFMYMGCIPYPRLHLFWNQTIGFSKIYSCLPRQRFQVLRAYIHFVDTSNVPDPVTNVFWKAQPIIDSVRRRCHEIERKIDHFSIDEQMIPFTGRMPARQFVKGKPRPVGLKNFVVTTSSGLVLDFEPYQGVTTNLKFRELGLGPSVVLRLTETLTPGSFLYFDRYFSTVRLFKELDKMGFQATGTILLNRLKQIKFKNDRQLKRGESQEFMLTEHNSSISVVKWKDTKCVTTISTISGINPACTVDRWCKQEKKKLKIDCPNVIKDYNSHMGGVDICDQQLEYYRTYIKTKKWPVKIAHHFIDLAIVNSWMEYRIDCETLKIPKAKWLDLLMFKMDVADSLICEEPMQTNRTDTVHTDEENDQEPVTKKNKMENLPSLGRRYSQSGHWPVWDDLSTAKMCRLKSCKCRTRCRCEKCNIYLCSSKTNHCFKIFHTMKN